MRNLLQSMSGVQLRLLWDRNIFIVLMNAVGVADAALADAITRCSKGYTFSVFTGDMIILCSKLIFTLRRF